MNTIEMLPYGVFAGRYRTREGADDVMADWRPNDPGRLEKFKEWRKEQLAFIENTFFPSNNASDPSKWIGAADGFASQVTQEELQIMVRELGFSHDDATAQMNSELYKPPSIGSGEKDHLHHFKVEDDVDIPAGDNFKLYDPSLTDQEHAELLNLAAQALGEGGNTPTKGAGLFWFKFRLVRPRPFQAAQWFAIDNFTCEIANTGFHSSAPSGHCLQGILLGCAILEGWLANGYDIAKNPNRTKALAQYMIDWGDRRVFAGVHYPTDNVISWWLTFQLIEHIFTDPVLIKQFASYAIQERSRIFNIVRDHFDAGPRAAIRSEIIKVLPDYSALADKLDPQEA